LKQPKIGWINREIGQPDTHLHIITDTAPIFCGKIQPTTNEHDGYLFVSMLRSLFGYVKDWGGKKIRRHLMRARKCKGFGWDMWSSHWISRNPGLFADYRVRYIIGMKALPAR
jgi:hypothetical protein